MRFTLITEYRRPVALVLDDDPAPRQLTTLFALLPAEAISLPDLAQRWNARHVLSTRDWAQAQRHRQPMFRPLGASMTILSACLCFLLSAFCFASPPTQGSGAANLLAPTALRVAASSIPSLPLPLSVTQCWYFAATAMATNGLESDYSNEVRWTSTNDLPAVTLSWEPSGANLTYRLYIGGSSCSYSNMVSAGTNLTLSPALYPPPLPPRTNFVLTVTSLNATNLQWSLAVGLPWHLLGATNYVSTNGPARPFWRALGRSLTHQPQVFLQATLQ